MSSSFGDGSNRWIPGLIKTVQNPVEAVANPVETVSGAADAAALNFDEGVGGLTSLFDNDAGNSAGVGRQGVFEDESAGPGSPRGLLNTALTGLIVVAVVFAVGQLITINIGDSNN